MDKNNQPLKISVQDGELVIRIGINTLAFGIANGSAFHRFDKKRDEYVRDFVIVDPTRFAKDVKLEMEREEEDGSSPMSDFIDAMSQAAMDEGSIGIEEATIIFGQKSSRENW